MAPGGSKVQRLLRKWKKDFRAQTAEAVRLEARDVFSDLLYKFTIQPLTQVNSFQHKTRHGYLVRHIIDRYFKENAKLADEFFDASKGQT